MLRIYSAIEGIDVTKSPQLFTEDNMFSFKEKLANKLVDKICPIGERAMQMCATEEDRLLDILDEGSRKANNKAQVTLARMKEMVGILRRRS